MQQIAEHADLTEDTRHLALEFVLTVVEAKPGMVRKKMPALVEAVFCIGLNWMLDLDDDSPWTVTGSEETELTSYEFGLECMDRLALKIGGKTLVPIVFSKYIPTFLQRSDWQARHAALMVISQISEGCRKTIGDQLGEVVTTVVNFFKDPHARVRFAAINCLGQMASDFSPDFQKNFHQILIPALVEVMDDVSSPQVQGHAASCVINFAEGAKKDHMILYSEGLLHKLIVLLQGVNRHVQEQAITAIAAIADCLEEKFIPYYDAIMPGLKTILATVPNDTREHQNLRGRATECVSVIAGGVGKEKFAPDAESVIQLFHQAQQSITSDDDAQAGFLIQSWSRLCRVLDKDFIQYLPHVLPSLFKAAQADECADVEDDDEDDDQIHIRTSVLEEKSTACGMICCYIEVLCDGFAPYVEEAAKVLLPLIDHYADDIRIAAATSLPLMMKAGVAHCEAKGESPSIFRTAFLGNCMDPLLNTAKEEMDNEVLQEQLQALGDLLDNAGKECLSEPQQLSAAQLLESVLNEALARRQEQADNRLQNQDDLDEEALEALQEEEGKEEEVMMMFMQATGAFLKAHGKDALVKLEPVVKKFLEMIKPECKAADRKLALLVMDDVLEYGQSGMHPVVPMVLPYYLQYLVDEDPSVRQAAAYGCGCLAEHGNSLEVVRQHAPAFMERLHAVINQPNARATGNVHSTDNCISAVGKFLEFLTGLDAQKLQTWLQLLPVTGDLEEAKEIYNRLCKFIEQSGETVLGPNNANLGKIIEIFASALETPAVDDDLTGRITRIVTALNQQMGPQLNQVCASLDPALMQKLQNLMR